MGFETDYNAAFYFGKNGNLIKPQTGSFFFIATLIVDLELNYDEPIGKDYCGTCTKCIDACPTHAILPNKTIEANHCISYFTIELKKETIETKKITKTGLLDVIFAKTYALGIDLAKHMTNQHLSH